MILIKREKQHKKTKNNSKPQQNFKIGRYKLRSVSLPNQRVAVIYQQNLNQINLRKANATQENVTELPQIWGCVVPEHLQKLQMRTLQRKSRSLSTRKIQTQKSKNLIKSRQNASIMLRNQYIKRKYKIKGSQIQEKLQFKCQKHKSVQSIITDNSISMERWNNQTPEEREQRQEEKRKTEQTFNKIKKLNEIIKWRSKVIVKMQEQLDAIKNQRIWASY